MGWIYCKECDGHSFVAQENEVNEVGDACDTVNRLIEVIEGLMEHIKVIEQKRVKL